MLIDHQIGPKFPQTTGYGFSNRTASGDLNTGECSSLGDIMEESDWELNSVVAMAASEGQVVTRGSTQAEKEVRSAGHWFRV